MERKVTLEMFSTMFDTHLIKRAGLGLTSQVLHWTTMIMINHDHDHGHDHDHDPD